MTRRTDSDGAITLFTGQLQPAGSRLAREAGNSTLARQAKPMIA